MAGASTSPDPLKHTVWYYPEVRADIALSVGEESCVYDGHLWRFSQVSVPGSGWELALERQDSVLATQPNGNMVWVHQVVKDTLMVSHRAGNYYLNDRRVAARPGADISYADRALPPTEERAEYAELIIQFLGAARKERAYGHYYYPLPFQQQESLTRSLKAREVFSERFFLTRPAAVRLRFGEISATVWLNPSEKTIIVVREDDDLHFAGANASLNLQYQRAYAHEASWLAKNQRAVSAEDPAEAIAERVTLCKNKRDYLTPILDTIPFSASFRAFYERHLELSHRVSLMQLKFNYFRDYEKSLVHYEATEEIYEGYRGQDLLHQEAIRLNEAQGYNTYLLRQDHLIKRAEVITRYLRKTRPEYGPAAQSRIQSLSHQWEMVQQDADLMHLRDHLEKTYRSFLQTHPALAAPAFRKMRRDSLFRYAVDHLQWSPDTQSNLSDAARMAEVYFTGKAAIKETFLPGKWQETVPMPENIQNPLATAVAREIRWRHNAEVLNTELAEFLPEYSLMRYLAFILRPHEDSEKYDRGGLTSWLGMLLENSADLAFLKKVERLYPWGAFSAPEQAWLRKKFRDRYQFLAKGSFNFFEVVAVEENSGEAFLGKLVEQHPGKVLFLDIWATWCAPCLAEFTMGKETKAFYGDKEVVFVYLCGGGCQEKEQKMRINEFRVEGEHYLLNGAVESDLFRILAGSGYPTYRVIDRQGNLLPVKTLRPSNFAEVKATIDPLLRQN